MPQHVYRYTFRADVPFEEIEASVMLAIVSAESLHGESQARLDIQHLLDAQKRACVIDAGTDVGRDLNRLFTGFLRREFGEDAFQVERLEAVSAPSAGTVA